MLCVNAGGIPDDIKFRKETILVKCENILYSMAVSVIQKFIYDELESDLVDVDKIEDKTYFSVLHLIVNSRYKNPLKLIAKDGVSDDDLDELYKKLCDSLSYEEVIPTNIYSVLMTLLVNKTITKAKVLIERDIDLKFLTSDLPKEYIDKISIVEDTTIKEYIKDNNVTTIFLDDIEELNDIINSDINIKNKNFILCNYGYNFKQEGEEIDSKYDILYMMTMKDCTITFINVFSYEDDNDSALG